MYFETSGFCSARHGGGKFGVIGDQLETISFPFQSLIYTDVRQGSIRPLAHHEQDYEDSTLLSSLFGLGTIHWQYKCIS